MTRITPRRRLSLLLLVLRERAPLAVALPLITAGAMLLALHRPTEDATCRERYGRARTAADSARVDAWQFPSRASPGWMTCGHMRRGGMLDRDELAREDGR